MEERPEDFKDVWQKECITDDNGEAYFENPNDGTYGIYMIMFTVGKLGGKSYGNQWICYLPELDPVDNTWIYDTIYFTTEPAYY